MAKYQNLFLLNPFVKLNKGTKSLYLPGEDIGIHVASDRVREVIIKKDNMVLARNSTDKSFTYNSSDNSSDNSSVIGDYQVIAVLDDGSESMPVLFSIAAVTTAKFSGSYSTDRRNRVIASSGQKITVEFSSSENTKPELLILEHFSHRSVSQGLIIELTPEEIANGKVTFETPVAESQDFRVRIRAIHPNGAFYSDEDAMILRINNLN